LLALDALRREQPLGDDLKPHLIHLIEEGLVERIGRGRGTRYILSRGLYSVLGQKGVYTRKKGLDRDAHKALLVKHIEDNRTEGSRLADLMQVLPSLSRSQVQRLLEELVNAGQVQLSGKTRGGKWLPGSGAIAPESESIPGSEQFPGGDSQRKPFD
jgi:ATP-dependent DNA helicase RecG